MVNSKALKISAILLGLMLLSIWVSKIFGYPSVEITNDQDAIVNGIWRPFAVAFSFIFSIFVFVMLVLGRHLKRLYLAFTK